MRVPRITALGAALAMTAFGAATAHDAAAASGGHHGAIGQACQADIAKLCPDVQPGGGRVMQCFRAHGDELSNGCKSALAAIRAEHRAAAGDATAPH